MCHMNKNYWNSWVLLESLKETATLICKIISPHIQSPKVLLVTLGASHTARRIRTTYFGEKVHFSNV